MQEQGEFDLAVSYAQEGCLTGRVAQLIVRYGQRVYFTGRTSTVLGWFTWFEEHGSIEDHPFVAALGGWTMAMEGRPFDTRLWADAATRSKAPRSDEAEGCLLLLRAAMCREGAETMRRHAGRASAILPPLSTWIPNAALMSGLSELLFDDTVAAERSFRACVERGAEMGTVPATSVALAELAVLALTRGNVEDAASLAKEARGLIDDAHLLGHPTSGLAYAVASRIALIQGDPVRARRYAQEAADNRSTLTVALPMLALQVRYPAAVGRAGPLGHQRCRDLPR